MAVVQLMKFGPITFSVFPLNFHESDHSTTADWARKDIMETGIHREWVGEGDEEIILRGRCFPFTRTIGIGAVSALDLLDAVRRTHSPQQLIRVSINYAEPLGWFILEKLQRHHTFVGLAGIGRQLNFDASFHRVDTPNPATYLNSVQQLMPGGSSGGSSATP